MQEQPRDFEPDEYDAAGIDGHDFGPDDVPGADRAGRADYEHDFTHKLDRFWSLRGLQE